MQSLLLANLRNGQSAQSQLKLVLKLAMLFTLLCITSGLCFAGMLDGADEIDGQFLAPQTGQPILNMVVDEPFDSDATIKKFHEKVEYYIRYMSSGEVYRKLPKANREMPVRIAVLFDRQPTEPNRKVIFEVRDRLVSKGFEVRLRVFDPQTRRSIELQP